MVMKRVSSLTPTSYTVATFRVVEAGQGSRLHEQPRVTGRITRHHLQRHFAVELGIMGCIDDPHPSTAHSIEDLVSAQAPGLVTKSSAHLHSPALDVAKRREQRGSGLGAVRGELWPLPRLTRWRKNGTRA